MRRSAVEVLPNVMDNDPATKPLERCAPGEPGTPRDRDVVVTRGARRSPVRVGDRRLRAGAAVRGARRACPSTPGSSISATLTGAGQRGLGRSGYGRPRRRPGLDRSGRPSGPGAARLRNRRRRPDRPGRRWSAAEAAAAPSTELAVAVYDRVTRESAVGDRGTEPFMTASLAKVVVAVDMLDRRRLDGLTITERTSRCCAGRWRERRQRDERALDQVRRAGRGGPGARAAGADRDQRPAGVRRSGARCRCRPSTSCGSGGTCSTRCPPPTGT